MKASSALIVFRSILDGPEGMNMSPATRDALYQPYLTLCRLEAAQQFNLTKKGTLFRPYIDETGKSCIEEVAAYWSEIDSDGTIHLAFEGLTTEWEEVYTLEQSKGILYPTRAAAKKSFVSNIKNVK